MILSLLSFFLIFFGALGLGFLLKHYQTSSTRLMRTSLFFVEAPIFFYSYWLLDLTKIKLAAPIPMLSIIFILTALGLTPWLAKRLLSQKTGQGSFILAAAFSNIGNTGGLFVCYLLFGLPGLALGSLFLLPYPFLIYTLGFSTAQKYASGTRQGWKTALRQVFTNRLSLVPLTAMASGLLLNILHFTPPQFPLLAGFMIKLNVAISCFAIGMTLKPQQAFSPLKPIIAMAGIKFLATPLLAGILIFFIYGSLESTVAKIILIQAAMPPAVYSVITANLFGLDRELANSLWFSNTLLLIPVVILLCWLL